MSEIVNKVLRQTREALEAMSPERLSELITSVEVNETDAKQYAELERAIMTQSGLPTRLAQALERKRTGMRTNSGHEDAKWSGINEEQARLAPLHRALVECVVALDKIDEGLDEEDVMECANAALETLDTAIKESGK